MRLTGGEGVAEERARRRLHPPLPREGGTGPHGPSRGAAKYCGVGVEGICPPALCLVFFFLNSLNLVCSRDEWRGAGGGRSAAIACPGTSRPAAAEARRAAPRNPRLPRKGAAAVSAGGPRGRGRASALAAGRTPRAKAARGWQELCALPAPRGAERRAQLASPRPRDRTNRRGVISFFSRFPPFFFSSTPPPGASAPRRAGNALRPPVPRDGAWAAGAVRTPGARGVVPAMKRGTGHRESWGPRAGPR